jgi:aminopeptidase N
MRRLTDLERIALIHDPESSVGSRWLATYRALLNDSSLPPGLQAYLLQIDESSLQREALPMYRERYAARQKLMKAVGDHFLGELLAVYGATDTYRPATTPKDGLELRRLKGVLLRIITEADTTETQSLAESHFREAWNITDRLSALQCINLSSHPRRRELMEEAFEQWHRHLSGYTSYLSIVATGRQDDVFDMLAHEEQRPMFRPEHPGHCRALFLPMASNNKLLWTDRGIKWVQETVSRMAGVNENTANRLVACFQLANRLADDLKPKVVAALEAIRDNIDEETAPSVAGRVRGYLETETIE